MLILRLLAINDPFTLAERLALTAELAALAREVGSSEFAWHAAVHRTGALLESGDIAGAERALAEVERLAGELRQPFYTWFARIGRTMLAIMRGAAGCGGTGVRDVRARDGGGPAGGGPSASGRSSSTSATRRAGSRELADTLRANVEAMPQIRVWRAVIGKVVHGDRSA